MSSWPLLSLNGRWHQDGLVFVSTSQASASALDLSLGFRCHVSGTRHNVISSATTQRASQPSGRPHSGSKRLKPAKNKFIQSDFTSFFSWVSKNFHNFRFRSWHALHIQNLSRHWRHKYDPSISRFFKLIIGGVLTLGPTVHQSRDASQTAAFVTYF